MAPLSEFERQRQENIQRNKDLLRKLDLDSVTSSISRDVAQAKPAPKKRKTKSGPKPIKQEVGPSRRSRRIAGVTIENTEEYRKKVEEEEDAKRRRDQIDQLRQTRLYGDFRLIDLVTDRLGHLKHEDRVIKNIKSESGDVVEIKQEAEPKQEDGLADDEIDGDHKVLQTLRELGDKFSTGDFFEYIRETPLEYDDKFLEEKRREFDNLTLFERFPPLDIQITHQRITSINFHPSRTDRIVTAGDKVGNLGIWAVDSSDDTPTISILKPHGKAVAKILAPVATPSKILSAAYDGSVRQLDLNKLESSEVAYLSDSSDYPLAVSDINLSPEDPNVLYLTTLCGNFYQHDTRTPFKTMDTKKLLRLHDKKIGSFSVNPNAAHQLATASLDRTLRLWDLRNISKANALWLDFEGDQLSPHPYGSFQSRLSVSTVDWNLENRLVCNGYDDKINLFDLSDPVVSKWSPDYQPGPKSEEDGIPNNLTPFTSIRHNCQTGRWVSILKARWQPSPADGVQKFAIANMNRGVDVYDQKGHILAHLTEEQVGAVPAVATLHPSENWVVGGSASGKAYFFQ